MKKTVESKVADAILQKSKEIVIGDVTYQVAPPSTATLILVSELVSQLPQVNLDSNDIMAESLKVAKDCSVMGDIVAVMILGAKGLKGTKTIEKKRFFGLIIATEEIEVNIQKELAKEVLENITPVNLYALVQDLLSGMEISFFFGISTFLIGVNLTKETKTETIQSGQ